MSISRLLLSLTLALSLTAPLLAVTPEERTLELPWRSNLADHAWVEGGALALRQGFALDRDPLWLSAASASVVEPKYALFRGGLGGESFADYPQRLEFFLEVTKPGKYYTWYRLRVKEAGTVKHLEGVDSAAGAPIGWVSLEIKEPNVWTWVRREGQVELTAGLHELQMDAWTPDVDVSRIVLASDEKFTPPAAEAGPDPAPPVPWTEGTAYTGEVQPSTVLKWGHLSYQTAGGGQIVLSYSTDGGKTWTPVPEGGDLSAAPVKADGADRLRFRALLRRAPDATSPFIGPLKLTYTGDKDDLFSLSDTTARYFFAKQTGALCGIQNAVTGTWLTPERRPQPIFSLRLRPVAGGPEKDWETVTSLDAKCLSATPPSPAGRGGQGGEASARFAYEIARPDGTATIVIDAFISGPGELTWTASVKNNLKQFDVVDLTYPIAYGVVAGSPQTDIMLINGNYLVHAPANFGRFLYYWPTGTAPLMDVFSDKQGLAVVAHDDTLRSTGISARGLEREAVELSLVKIVRIKPGRSFTGAPHLMRVHQGDWHTTALAERPWLAAHRPTAEPPLWLAECDGWVPTGWPAGWWTNMGVFADSTSPPLPQGEGAGGEARGGRGVGLPWIQYWNFQVPGTTWTIPHPNPVNGDEEELRWGIDQIHRRGIRTTFYIQGLLYDPQGDGASPDDPIGYLHRRDLWPGFELPGPGFADQWARRTADGEMHEWSKTEREMCYASRGFQEYKRKWAIDRFMGRLGADGIYWDSLSIGVTCWATNHGHGDDPGQWGMGAQANHTLILQQARKLNPAAVFAAEGPPIDTLGNVVDVHLDNCPNLDVVRFLFPKMLVYLGSADGADPTRRKAFLYGCRFDGIGADADQQALLRIRRLTKQYLYPATPMDTMGLKIESPPHGAGFQPAQTIQARWFLCDPTRTKGAVVTILNDQKLSGYWMSVPFGYVGPAWLVDSDGQDGPCDAGALVEHGCNIFKVPTAQASTILFLRPGAEPRVTVTNDTLVSRGGEAQVTVKIESLTRERAQGTISASPPGTTGVSPVAGGGKVAAPPIQSVPFDCSGFGAQAQTVTLILPVLATAPLGLTDVPITIKLATGVTFQKLATFYVEPPVRVTPTWAKPELLKIIVENRSLTPQTGTVTLQPVRSTVRFAPSPLATRDAQLATPFSLAPGAQTVLSVPLIGAYACQTPWSVKGELKVGGQTYPLYTPFRAAILNGSLELHKWRQDVPDWWWGTYVDRSPKICGAGEYSVDDTMAAAGKYSLKVVGKVDEWRAANLDLVLTPGQTYRFSCKIRRTAHARGISASIYENRRLPDGKTEGVSHMIGQQTEGPLNEWQEFSTVFTALPLGEQAGARLYLYNDHSPATVWFDDMRLVPEEAG
jgi:hypothetical protein